MRKKQIMLYPEICPECKQLLCWSKINTETFCPNCRKWHKQEGEKAVNNA